MKVSELIKTISYNQHEIILNIINLHLGGKKIGLDPTYSKGNFYRSGIEEPLYKSDLKPQVEGCETADASNLRFNNGEISSIMFDPPFIAGQKKKSGIIGHNHHVQQHARKFHSYFLVFKKTSSKA